MTVMGKSLELIHKLFPQLPAHQREAWNENCFTQKYLVIDLELTGLNPKADEIVSIGWVPIEEQRIRIGQGEHCINAAVADLRQSPVYHEISEQMLKTGHSLESIFDKLQPYIFDYVWVFHNSELDWAFLKLAFSKIGLTQPGKGIIDTMEIEHRRLARQGQVIPYDALGLSACRNRYNLPEYPSHNALTDATATAELLLAQINQISRGKPLLLKHLY